MYECDFCGVDVNAPDNLVAVWLKADQRGLLACHECCDILTTITIAEDEYGTRDQRWTYQKWMPFIVKSAVFELILYTNTNPEPVRRAFSMWQWENEILSVFRYLNCYHAYCRVKWRYAPDVTINNFTPPM